MKVQKEAWKTMSMENKEDVEKDGDDKFTIRHHEEN